MENYEKYAEYTRALNWAAICEMNGVELDSFGTKKELRALPSHLENDEVVFALTSGIMEQTETSNSSDWGRNTWLVVLTSQRFLFLDCAMLTSSVDTQSIRHNRVQAVSASQGWFLGKIMVDLGSRIITIDNCMKATVKPLASLANKWHEELENRKAQPVASPEPVPNTVQKSDEVDPLESLERLAKLHAAGALSDEEFSAAKSKLIASM